MWSRGVGWQQPEAGDRQESSCLWGLWFFSFPLTATCSAPVPLWGLNCTSATTVPTNPGLQTPPVRQV